MMENYQEVMEEGPQENIVGAHGRKKKSVACRILLNETSTGSLAQFMERLREDSCKTDTSKIVNSILKIFFQKYESIEYEHLVHEFFDKKSYLKKLIHNVSDEDLDRSIETYLGKVSHGKGKSRRRSKTRGGQNKGKDCQISNESNGFKK